MEWFVWTVAVLVAVAIALVESIRFAPSGLSQAELERRASKGDVQAKNEFNKRTLLPLYYGLQRLKVTFLVLALVGILAGFYPLWIALLASFGMLLAVGVVVAMGWLSWLARFVQPRIEKHVWRVVKAGAPVLKFFAPKMNGGNEISFASKDELKQMIEHDTSILSADEKTRLVAAMHFGGKTVGDIMVPAGQIATVGQSETVGPLLLDKLHKTGHKVIVVVSRGLDNIKGLLYMSDLVPLDPEIQTVKDALRSKVFYVSADAPLAAVLAASLKTGRQLFLVAKAGKTVGLITLSDALEHLLGGRLGGSTKVAPRPEDLE